MIDEENSKNELNNVENDIEDEEDIDDSEDSEDSIPNESKNEKFLRLAERRTNKIISYISKLGYLSNKINYKYTEDEVEQMFAAIEEQLRTEKEKFYTQDKQETRFTFRK